MLPLHLLLSLNKAQLVRALKLGAWAAVLALVAYCYLQHVALRNAELVYQNPRKVERIRTVKVQGPVRIVTRTVEVAGRKETTTEETRGAVIETTAVDRLAEPVFPPAPRSDRWLVGASINPLRYGELQSYTGYAGYSIRNRVDLCAGVTGGGRPSVLAMLRF